MKKVLISTKNNLETIGGVEVFCKRLITTKTTLTNDRDLFKKTPSFDSYVINLPSLKGLRIILETAKKNYVFIYHHGRDLSNLKMLPYYIIETFILLLIKRTVHANFKFNLLRSKVVEGFISPEIQSTQQSTKSIDCLYVGRLEYYKGAHNIPKIFDLLRQKGLKNFVVIGEGKYSEIIKEDSNLKDYELLDFQTRKDLLKYYSKSKYILIPAVTNQESLSFVQIEAMNCGVVPIINPSLKGVIRPHKILPSKSFISLEELPESFTQVEFDRLSKNSELAGKKWLQLTDEFISNISRCYIH